MFRKLLIVSLAVATLASCKKDKNDTPAYNLSAKFDGTSKSFNTGLFAEKEQSGELITIAGSGGSASSPYPAFNLTIQDDVAIKAQTYTATNGEAGAVYVTSGSSMFLNDTDFSITISSITNTEVKGTFSGKLAGGATVTEGSFSAKFQ